MMTFGIPIQHVQIPPSRRYLNFPFGGETIAEGTTLKLDGWTYRIVHADYVTHWYTLEIVL